MQQDVDRNEKPEYRTLTAELAVLDPTDEQRAKGAPQHLAGYAVVWDAVSVPLYGFREKFQAGAFAEHLRTSPDVKALVDHKPTNLLGRTTSGTLIVKEDDKGLKMTVAVPDTTLGRDTVTLVKRGDLSQMSFAFYTKEDRWERTDDGELRTVIAAELVDVSIVTYPAYEATSVMARSALADVGISTEVIVRTLERIRRGLEITSGDASHLRRARGIIDGIIEKTAADATPTAGAFRPRCLNARAALLAALLRGGK